MKKEIIFLPLIPLLILCSGSASQNNTNEIILQQGNLKVTIDTKHAGNIISFQYKGNEVLIGSDVHPLNFGSTLWPAPQSNWNWPPPSILDDSRYKIQSVNPTVKLASEPDTLKTGLQFKEVEKLLD